MARKSTFNLLDLRTFLIKEQVAFLRKYDVYDIFDPESGEQVGTATEIVGGFTQFLRFLVSKKLMSIQVDLVDKNDMLVFRIRKPFGFFRERVDVYDSNDELIGYFKSKILSLTGGFYVFNRKDKQVAEIKGKWVGFEFTFLDNEGQELGKVTKKWAGLAKEMFTSADNYIVSISEDLDEDPDAKCLLLAAAIAIDVVYYENQG